MQSFRNLTNNIFFKIFLGFVALSFVFFGISGFVLGGGNNWVAKVGDVTISQNSFLRALKADRDVILASSNSEEALKYLESPQFKSDVLGRLTNQILIEQLHEDLGIEASRELILKSIAKDPSFKNDDGKFDHAKFEKFLASKGYNEERYVKEIADNVVATMAIQTLSMVAPIDLQAALEAEKFNKEKRLANVVSISAQHVKTFDQPTKETIATYFEENKHQYQAPQYRQVSILRFSQTDFAADFKITEKDLLAAYEEAKDRLKTPETRDFLHILFEKEDDATAFANSVNKADKKEVAFVNHAKKTQNKKRTEITLNDVHQKDLMPQLADKTFALTKESDLKALKSPLGFHVFLVTNINPAKPISYAEAKKGLKADLLKGREEKVLQEKITAIDDSLLASNSLDKTATQFGFQKPISITINDIGRDQRDNEVKSIAGLHQFVENAFALNNGQISKIFYAQNDKNETAQAFYVIKLEKIIDARTRDLAEVKNQVRADLIKSNKAKALKELVKKIGDEIKANPKRAANIAAKYHVKFERNREFTRVVYFQVQGRQVPYQNQFLEELFDLKIGQSTSVIPAGADEFAIGVLQKIMPSDLTSIAFAASQERIEKEFKTELLQEYNAFLLDKHPVRINEKLLQQ